MFGSGVAIGKEITHQVAKPTQPAHHRVAAASCVGVVGTARRGTVVFRFVATVLLRVVALTAASVWFASHSLK